MNFLKLTLIVLFAMGAVPMLGLGMHNTGVEPIPVAMTSFWGGFLYLFWRL